MKPIPVFTLVAGVILAATALVRSGPSPSQPSALPDQVVANAVIAHKRLQQLRVALSIYLNDSLEQLDDPIHLLSIGDLNPEMFWHPGDNDPAPTEIDNSIANAPNSAQVSFLFWTGNFSALNDDDIIIWDASPMNNAGLFVSYICSDGGIETIPPVELPFPTNMSIARTHLRRISKSFVIYAADNADSYPQTLRQLHPDYLTYPRSIWNPGDADPMPTALTNDLPNGLNSSLVSFDFPAAGMFLDTIPSDMAAMQDNTAANNVGLGVYAIMGDGAVRFMPTGEFGDINNDSDIDLADWAFLQCCYTGFNPNFDEIENDLCRLHDFDSDGHVNVPDNAAFVEVMTGPLP